jgi:predicted ATPase
MIHLQSIACQSSNFPDTFPFNVPIIRALRPINFSHEITFLVGENGSGKSTLLEAIACAVGSITVGAESVETDPSLAHSRQLAKQFKLTWSKRTRKGFYMRSEDFFGFVKHLTIVKADLENDLQQVDVDYQDRTDYAKGLARMPYARELHDLQHYYGDSLDSYSHGESYFTLFNARFVAGGLYLLDEPEAPLSPMRQLSFITMLGEMMKQDAQFIIATHSPILMAFPNATILSFDGDHIENIAYDDLEHVQVTRSFLNNPDQYLRHLLDD